MPDVVPHVVQEEESSESIEDNKSQSDSEYSDEEDKDSLFLFGQPQIETAAEEESMLDSQFDFQEFVP